jgi:hypothetical protein
LVDQQCDQDNSNELATHALAFMLAGVTKRWKQVVAYEFTGNSFSANEFHDKVASILKKCTEIGLLFRSAYDLFTEPALTWYRSVRDTVGTWNQLVTLLKTNFLPSDYDETIWETLRSRFQRSDEPTPIYVAAMTNIFNRLTITPRPEEQLHLIKRKILPRYITALALQKVDSIEQLLSFCRRIDEADEATSRNPVKNPPAKPVADISKILCPDHRDDNRPYVPIKIYNESITALLDSAANRSVLGRDGLQIVNFLGLAVQAVPENLLVTTAGDSRHLITGLVQLPISLKDRVETLPVLVVPSLNHTLILGVDFFKLFQVSLTAKDDAWLVDVRHPRPRTRRTVYHFRSLP